MYKISEDMVGARGLLFSNKSLTEVKKIFKQNKTFKRTKEKGCTEPLVGKKAKCVLKIVPQEDKCNTFEVDKKCIKKRLD